MKMRPVAASASDAIASQPHDVGKYEPFRVLVTTTIVNAVRNPARSRR